MAPLGEVGWGLSDSWACLFLPFRVLRLASSGFTHTERTVWSLAKASQDGGELTVSGCSWAIIYKDSLLRASSRARPPCPGLRVFGRGQGMSAGELGRQE